MKKDFSKINFNRVWTYPKTDGSVETKTQQDFWNELVPTGHKIFSDIYYPNINYEEVEEIKDKITGKISYKKTHHCHYVNRIGFNLQKMALDIFLAHFLGNKIKMEDITIENKNEASLPLYKDIWITKNMESLTYSWIKDALSVGQSAIVFYYDTQRKRVVGKVHSFATKDMIYLKKDVKGNPIEFYRKYVVKDNDNVDITLIDVIDKTYITTYTADGDIYDQATPHGFPVFPVSYLFYEKGTFWQDAQYSIEDLELLMSRLSEDNRTKTIPKQILKTEDPSKVKPKRTGRADVLIMGLNDDYKMVSGADLSPAFKFEYETILEYIQNLLGIVFPKHKSSGDMPTGSMKMMFYPTERVVMDKIHLFNESLDNLNEVFQRCIVKEYPNFGFEKLIYRASFDLFTPQDKSARIEDISKLYASGLLSLKQASNEISALGIGNNSNYVELIEEKRIKDLKESEKQDKEVQKVDTIIEEKI